MFHSYLNSCVFLYKQAGRKKRASLFKLELQTSLAWWRQQAKRAPRPTDLVWGLLEDVIIISESDSRGGCVPDGSANLHGYGVLFDQHWRKQLHTLPHETDARYSQGLRNMLSLQKVHTPYKHTHTCPHDTQSSLTPTRHAVWRNKQSLTFMKHQPSWLIKVVLLL